MATAPGMETSSRQRRRVRHGWRLFVLVALALQVLGSGHAAPAQEPDWKKEADALEAEIERLEADVNEFTHSPDAPAEWLELLQVGKQMSEMRAEHREELRPLEERHRELSRTEAVRERRQEVSRLRRKVQEMRRQYQEMLLDRGRRVQERRLEELAQIAVADTPNARRLGFNVFSYPAEDGSTSTIPLSVVIACRLLETDYEWKGRASYSAPWAVSTSGPEEIAGQPWGSGRLRALSGPLSLVSYRPVAVPSEESRRQQRLAVIVNRMLTTHSGTHDAYVNVIQGAADVALIAREPSAEELELAREEGVELVTRVAAHDAFVFMTHDENPVTDLSAEQIRGIYSGRITDWNQVGGPEGTINPYQRDEQSGSQQLMKSVVMQDLGMVGPAGELVRPGMGGPFLALTADRRGIAYSVYYYEHFMAASPRTKLIAVDGVMPSYETIRDRTYPFVTNVHLVTRKDQPADSPAARWRDWLLSPEGQAVVRESGYVPARPSGG